MNTNLLSTFLKDHLGKEIKTFKGASFCVEDSQFVIAIDEGNETVLADDILEYMEDESSRPEYEDSPYFDDKENYGEFWKMPVVIKTTENEYYEVNEVEIDDDKIIFYF